MDATLVTGWEALCQLLGSAFTRPTFTTLLYIATGLGPLSQQTHGHQLGLYHRYHAVGASRRTSGFATANSMVGSNRFRVGVLAPSSERRLTRLQQGKAFPRNARPVGTA